MSVSLELDRDQLEDRKMHPQDASHAHISDSTTTLADTPQAKNKGYNYYSTMFTAPDTKHPWYKFFDPVEDLDNAETSSAAMATKASGDVLVFGGAKYQTEGPSSFFTLHEIGPLHDGLKNGRVKNLIHMEKGATKLSQVFATEDANGRYTYKNNHKAGDDNATGKHGVCNAAAAVVSPVLGVFNAITCDAPQPNPKKPASDSSKPSKGMALSIVMHTGVAAHGTSAEVINTWKFYTTKANKAVGSCGETEGKEIKADSNDTPKGGANASLKKPPFPGGTFGLDIEGEKCTYKNDGATAGKLICPKREISCSADKMKDKEEGSLKCGNNQFLHAVVYCEF